MQGASSYSKCPGGPEQLNPLATAAARRRMEDGEAEELLPVGPIIADEGWFIEAEECMVAKANAIAVCGFAK